LLQTALPFLHLLLLRLCFVLRFCRPPGQRVTLRLRCRRRCPLPVCGRYRCFALLLGVFAGLFFGFFGALCFSESPLLLA
jgi:hypothetical protein